MDNETVLDFLVSSSAEERVFTDEDKRFWLNVSYLARKALSKGDNQKVL